MVSPIKAARNQGVGVGMAIAAALVAEWDDTRAEEILHVCGLTTFDALRNAGVDDYDLKKLRHVVQNISQRRRNLSRKLGFARIDAMAA